MNRLICEGCGQDWMDIKMDIDLDEPMTQMLMQVGYHCNYCKKDILPIVTPQIEEE